MMQAFLQLLIFFAWTGTAFAAAPGSSCADQYSVLSAVPKKWGDLLWRNPHPKSVSGTKAYRYQEAVIAKMKRKGFDLAETDQPTYLRGIAEAGETKVLADGSNWSYGGIYSMKRLPPALASGGPGTVAWLHPEMQATMDLVRSLGGDVVMDTSLGFTQVAAYFSEGTKNIVLRPGSSWQTFQHELQHFFFDKYVKTYFDRHLGANSLGRIDPFREDFMGMFPYLVKDVGEEKVRRIQQLLQAGVKDELAVNEMLSTEAELKLLGWKSYLPIMGTGPRQYGLYHQINALENKGSRLTEAEKQLLTKKKRENLGWMAYDAVGALTVSAPVLGYGGVKLYDHRQEVAGRAQKEFDAKYVSNKALRNSFGEQFLERRDGHWDCWNCFAGSAFKDGLVSVETTPVREKIATLHDGRKVSFGYYGYSQLIRKEDGSVFGIEPDGKEVFLRKDQVAAPPVPESRDDECDMVRKSLGACEKGEMFSRWRSRNL